VPRRWMCRLYLVVTVVVNLSVLVMWPKVVNTAAVAKECLPLCLVAILWGVYVPFRCHRGFAAWIVSGLAILGALFWLWTVMVVLLPLIV